MTFDAAAIPPLPADPLELDLRGLHCPMPVLRTRKVLAGLEPGRCLRVSSTDPLAGLDIPNLLRESGDVLVGTERIGATLFFTIRKS